MALTQAMRIAEALEAVVGRRFLGAVPFEDVHVELVFSGEYPNLVTVTSKDEVLVGVVSHPEEYVKASVRYVR